MDGLPCRNKGFIFKVAEYNGYTMVTGDCKCMPIRKSILRMKRSGLAEVIKKYTFNSYETKEQWQETIKTGAMEFSKDPQGWFSSAGRVVVEKTHICTAICRSLLLAGNEVYYMKWRDDVSKLKAFSLDSEERNKMLEKNQGHESAVH